MRKAGIDCHRNRPILGFVQLFDDSNTVYDRVRPFVHQRAIQRSLIQDIESFDPTNSIENGAEPNVADHQKRTPLHIAVERKMPDVIKALLAAGVDASARNDKGQTAKELALSMNLGELAALLP